MKTYEIGGRKFELRPLTLRQRHLASAFEQKMREIIMKIAEAIPKDKTQTLRPVYDVSVQVDELLYSEDEALEKFLATILTPAEAEKWTPAMIDTNKEIMWEITEDVQAEVLRDFFGRMTNSPLVSPISINPSMSEPKPSEMSEDQKDLMESRI